MRGIFLLHPRIQEYEWGSRTAIPELLGQPSPAATPQAELWMGAHPLAPAEVELEGERVALDRLIRRDPAGILGEAVSRRFGGELPFLFKLLAAAQPLSIQVHPDRAQARAGFERENLSGIAFDAAERNYRDANHKPEILYALTPFWALIGFRPIPTMLRLLEAAGFLGISRQLRSLRQRPDGTGLRSFFASLMALEAGVREQAIREAAAHARAALSGQPAEREVWEWIVRLGKLYPGDIGVLSPLLLNLVRLEPGQAFFLPAGVLHAYLEGAALELMANSDNVIRGGLTSKHIDAEELLRIVSFESREVEPVRPRLLPSGERLYATPAEEFLLSEIRLDPHCRYRSPRERSVEILLCLSGRCRLYEPETGEELMLKKGTCALVPAALKGYELAGRAQLYKAAVPPPDQEIAPGLPGRSV